MRIRLPLSSLFPWPQLLACAVAHHVSDRYGIMDDVADDPNAKDHERLLAYLLRSLDALTAGSARPRPYTE